MEYFFGGFHIIFYIVFFIILSIFIISIIRDTKEWSYNNKQPVLDVRCKVVSKRTDITRSSGHIDANGIHHSGGSNTMYYITFEFESTDRMELKVSGKEFGMIVEGDTGILKFQGSRYLSFKRDITKK